MSDAGATSVTALLNAAGRGDEDALQRAFTIVYDELRRLASTVRAGRASDTYNATALVHEAYLKLTRSEDLAWTDRTHFMRLAARAMRQVLVDKAGHRGARKRGSGAADVTLSESLSGETSLSPEDLIDLDAALSALADESPRAASVIECRFFGAMSAEDTATALDVSLPTVTRDWRYARAWLTRRLAS